MKGCYHFRRMSRSPKLAAAAALLCAACGGPARITPDPRIEEIARQAYLYGVAPVQYRLVRWQRLHDPAARFLMKPNEFQHGRTLSNPESGAVTPNNDVLTSQAYLDLSAGPVVLHIPPSRGRYVSVQLIDAYTNSTAVFDRPGAYPIHAPTSSVWLIARVQCDGREDLTQAREVQDGLRLVAPAIAVTPEPALDLDEDPLRFFELLNRCLSENPPPQSEAPLMREFAYIRVGPGMTFDPRGFDEPARLALRNGMAAAKEQIAVRLKQREGRVNGWEMPPSKLGDYGADYELRAATALTKLGANRPSEAMFPGANEDAMGHALDGRYNYVLRFEKGQTPPVEAFWSLTIYRLPSFALVSNDLWRFSLGSRSRGLQRGADGSLEFLIQHKSPGKDREANWLPAPPGPFYLVMRLYRPQPDLVSGTYRLPAVRRVELAQQ